MNIGVLALQGAFIEHIDILSKLGAKASEIRLPGDLTGLDGLIIPGGESTTIMKLMDSFNFIEPLRKLARSGFPIWGTCAGLICLADHITDSSMETLAVMDITVRRNAFGRQVDSFETDLPVAVLGEKPYHAVFIRAPVIECVGSQVKILAEIKDKPVAAQQENLLVTAFHPELTADPRFHLYFTEMATPAMKTQSVKA